MTFDDLYRDARKKLVDGAERNLAEGDPLADLIEGVLAITDVLPLVIKEASKPISDERLEQLAARVTKAAQVGAAAGRRDLATLAAAIDRRTISFLCAGFLAAFACGYGACWRLTAAEVVDSRDGLMLELRNAHGWLDLIRANPDISSAVANARVWTDTSTGRKAGAVPLYLEPARGVPVRP